MPEQYPTRWPDGERVVACFTFDLDAESAVLSADPTSASRLGHGGADRFGGKRLFEPSSGCSADASGSVLPRGVWVLVGREIADLFDRAGEAAIEMLGPPPGRA